MRENGLLFHYVGLIANMVFVIVASLLSVTLEPWFRLH